MKVLFVFASEDRSTSVFKAWTPGVKYGNKDSGRRCRVADGTKCPQRRPRSKPRT